jgi:thioesterase domain-containing protein/acyl carrier protein
MLSPQKVPRAIAFVADIPQGPTGKPLRRELAAAMAPLLQPTAADEQVEDRGPSAELAREMAAVWSGVLGLDPIAIDDDLVALGADSLQFARIVAATREALGVEISLPVLFEQRTPARIAAWTVAQTADAGARTTAGPQAQLDLPVFVVVSGIDRNPVPVARLGPAVDPGRSFHELAVQIRANRVTTNSQVKRMARSSLETVRAAQPHGPYDLVGTGTAGAVAVAMARQLEDAGEEARLLLVEAWNPALRAPQSERNERETRRAARTTRRNTKRRERRRQDDRISSGLVTLIATVDALTENATLGWDDVLRERLRVVSIGPHQSRRELMQGVVRALRDWLRESEPA